MKVIISPARKMKVDTDTLPCRSMPVYLNEALSLLAMMQQLSYEQCRDIWNCSEKLARYNYERLCGTRLEGPLTPAVIAYEGIQYQYMAPSVMEEEALDWLQEHLFILSGFYGILKPFDGVAPYRLEMQARLGGSQVDSLYDYWGAKPAGVLLEQDEFILNLASREYAGCVEPYIFSRNRGIFKNDKTKDIFPELSGGQSNGGVIGYVTCVFGELSEGRVRKRERL